jgi:hypothetical protein
MAPPLLKADVSLFGLNREQNDTGLDITRILARLFPPFALRG